MKIQISDWLIDVIEILWINKNKIQESNNIILSDNLLEKLNEEQILQIKKEIQIWLLLSKNKKQFAKFLLSALTGGILTIK